LERFRPASGRDRAPVLGTIGGLRAEKDHATLLRAFASVIGAGRQCRLRIVGGGVMRDELRALTAELGVAAAVDFVGAVSDTAPEYRELDVFVLSSRTEQMPIALLEAMASGCAVVATDVGDVRVILPDSQQPFVVRKEDPAALAAALAAILDDPTMRRRLGEDNRRQVAGEYESRVCLDRFARLYERAMRRSR
ncbi:MAG: glycosyltransferase, partial [Planctomycetes bacterium]|nr:glycosyltransferase [Planctomycetota bacterium]